MNNEQRYFDALKKIAREYQTADQLRRRTGQYGCSFEEEIEMAYENIQQEARAAIKGRRRPVEPPPRPDRKQP
ncbi:hypothetical protein [uncultured Bradyrhizobium sp.]|uniref:hypothetical protein n=1 Tax=uncultured Bradyrhizobium sp. TaxID=199684 RepID=UPI0035CBAECA